jgi:uncharacterized protein (DUF2062 family)
MTAEPSTSSSQTPAVPHARSFWQRRVQDPIVAQLTQGATPDKVALTLGIGLAGGLFPFLGFTTLLCTVAAIVLRLNQPIIQIVNQVLWPVHFPGMFVYAWLATKLFKLPPIPFDPEEIKRLLFHEPGEFLHRFGHLGLCMFVVWLASAPLLVAGIYYPVRPLLRKFAALRQARAAKA